jgi:GH15 family glucan-1,4-alpha-glucosidase
LLSAGPKQARELCERLFGHTNDLGLLAEEIDSVSGELLGYFPRPSATSG